MDLTELSKNIIVEKYTLIPEEGGECGVSESVLNNDEQNSNKLITSSISIPPSTASTNNTTNHDNILKPGSKIKPNITTLIAENLIERLYGITLESIKELISYDDRNYLVYADKHVKNPIITYSPNGYVLKILNKLDSTKTDFIDAQTKLMIFLRNEKYICPIPIKNIYGQYYSIENINGTNHIIRLLEYIPGEIFHQIKPTKFIYYECGEFIAKIDRTLQKFNHDIFLTHTSLWQLQSLPQLKDFIYVLKDHERKEIVEQIIEQFDQKVLKIINNLQKGIIHGDLNEQNILVQLKSPANNNSEYRILGVIDFGDTNLSPLIFELAIAITYMIVHSKDLSTGGLVIAGYTSIRCIDEQEKDILKICVAARLCQSLVMGAYTHSLEPDNDYVLFTQTSGWELLQSLWIDKFHQIDQIWDKTADKYLKQSIK